MGKIQSNVGLITGIPITDTVDQLIQVASRPRDLLTSRNQGLQQQRLAINSLSTKLLGLKFDLSKLSLSKPFQARSVISQNEDVLTASLASGGKPPLGNFALRPAQTASSQQLISQRFESLDDIQSSGALAFGFGGFVNQGISLDELNAGSGVARGQIQISDLAGNSATIDLSLARTVDDVLEAINNASGINVTAAVDGDRFTLTDNVGGASTLTVQEVNGRTTAADLGLKNITTTVIDEVGSGDDVFGLHTGTKLTRLNDGNGVRLLTGQDDLVFTLRDGSSFGVDLSGSTTLGAVVDAINDDADNGGNLTASIDTNTDRLVVTDNTGSTASNLIVANTSEFVGSAADDLGITADVAANSVSGNRLVAGLRDTLLSSLNGGQGLTALGNLDLTDRSGTSATVDLSSAETLGEILTAINAAGTNITASFNEAGHGILLTDSVGGLSDLVVANNVDGLLTADSLGLAVSAAQDSIGSGSLNRQTLSEATLLSSLGEGITANDIRVTDTNGVSVAIDLNASGNTATTLGDVIDAINNATVGVTASINATGDGILLTDTALGGGTLGVKDINGTLAADLKLTRASETIDLNGTDTQVIDGTTSYSVDLSDLDGSPASVSLAAVNDGSGVTLSDIRITASDGKVLALDLDGKYAGVTTVGQLIDAINTEAATQSGGIGITASLNDSETGILITDTAGGAGDLLIEDINGTAAADLKILSNDNTTDSVNGVGLFSAQSASQGALQSVADRINDLGAGVTASVLNDGVGFRLQLGVDQTGNANRIAIETGDSGFRFEEIASAEDALLVIGGNGNPGSGVLVSSSTNDFDDVVKDVNLTIKAPSDTPVDVTIDKSDEDLVELVQDFVDAYNSIRSDLDKLTDFDGENFTTGLLFGTNEALRVDTQLSRVATDRYFGVGSFESLEEIGIGVDDQGKLQLDTAQLQAAFAEDAQSLQTFFTDSESGVVAKFEATIESLAGAESGLLTNRNDSLQATIDLNLDRIERFNASLDRQRERLLLQFFQLEQVIAGLQSNQTALNALQPVAPLVSAS